MLVYNEVCVYVISSTSQLALYFTVYCRIATEVEYMVLTEYMKEAIWLQGLLDDLGIDQDH